MILADCLEAYFDQYLPNIKGASEQTIASYRQCFTLLLKFAAGYYKLPVKELQMENLTRELIFAFLYHLEQDRENSARSRNSRLAAIKSLAKMIRLLYPEHREIAETILKTIYVLPKKADKIKAGRNSDL